LKINPSSSSAPKRKSGVVDDLLASEEVADEEECDANDSSDDAPELAAHNSGDEKGTCH